MEITDSDEIELINKYRDGYRGVYWHVVDFEYRAEELENLALEDDSDKFTPIYDRAKFEDALDRMLNKHDCNIGITWDTVDYYLDTYCLMEEQNE